MDVAVGIIDVKSYYIETPEDVAARVRRCLAFARPERLAFAPDCGLSQTARWAARRKLANMVEACGACARSWACRDRPGAEGRRPAARRRRRRRARRTRAPLVAGAERLPGAVRRRTSAARPVPVRFADRQVRQHRQAARAHDRTRDRSGAARLHRRRHVESQPHRPSRRRDTRPAALRQPGHDDRRSPKRTAASSPTACGSIRTWPVGLAIGEHVDVGPFRIEAVPAAHEALDPQFVGYVVRCGPWTLYHSGDTVRYEGMADVLRPHAVDVALLPINGRAPERRVAGNLDAARSRGARRATSARAWPFPATTRCSRSTRQTPRRSSRPAVPSVSAATSCAAASSGPAAL